ncbi:peptide deformylase (plasmid) [Phyllobacteriaceae bacterium JZ32]
MTVRPVVMFPDPGLRKVAEPVTAFGEEIRSRATDLLDTVRSAGGIGITAPHIGIQKQLVVLDLWDGAEVRTYVNPRIVWTSPELTRHAEGSISMPGVREEVKRHARVRVDYQDLDGIERSEETEGLLAICHQHEIDQLNGLFWIYKLSRLKRERLIKRYQKLRPGAAITDPE